MVLHSTFSSHRIAGKKPIMKEVDESAIMKDALEDIDRISEAVYSRTVLQISSIAQKLNIQTRILPWAETKPNIVNMLGWHQFPTCMPRRFHEGSDEVMLALYKINELVFKAIVLYPFKVYNFESGKYEYKKNSFMKFIPHERNKNYELFDETVFFWSTVDNILEYFDEFDRIQTDPSADNIDKDLLVFAMYFDFMSYVAQRLGCYHDRGV